MLSKLKLFFILCFFYTLSASANDDSTGVILRNGKVFKLHQVESGQGLQAIARIYKVQWTDIKDANPGSEKGLKKGQTLLVPTFKSESEFFGNQQPVYTKSKSEYTKPKPNVDKPSKSASEKSKETPGGTSFTTFYTVQKGETLYGISRKFSTTVEFLVQLNRLKSTQVEVGKDILVPISDPTLNTTKDSLVTETKNDYVIVPEVEKIVKEPAVNKDTIPFKDYSITIENLPEYSIDKVVERGQCKISNDKKLNQGKELVFHHNVPENTIIRITNPKNNKSTYVKVVKNFNRSKSDPVILYLNKKTADFLEVDKKNPSNIIISFAK
jgi:LysM repeat protein